MALQMPVYRELTTIESKVFMGMSWRQCLAAVILVIVCGGGYVGLWLGLGVDPEPRHVPDLPARPAHRRMGVGEAQGAHAREIP